MLRNIKIEAVLNGFIVECGCQRIAYTSVEGLISDLENYLRDPDGTERRIIKEKGINRKHTLPPEPDPCAGIGGPAPDCASEDAVDAYRRLTATRAVNAPLRNH